MFNPTIRALEAMDSAGDFERLCSTLLLPVYNSINPIGGTGDRGKDAIGELWEGRDQAGRRVVFAFSVEATWEAKLRRDLNKARDNKLEPSRFVFVTNRHVTNKKRFNREDGVPKEFGWEFELYDQEWLRTRLEHPDYLHLREQYLHLAPDTLPAFLSPREFFDRQQRSVLVSFDIPFAGRAAELESLKQWIASGTPLLVVHGAGGLGKSRLCYELAESLVAKGDVEPVFLRVNAEEFESHLAELVPNKKYVVIVDDAHRFEHLPGLEELIANSSFDVKLLLNTRPVFRHQVTGFADGKYEIQEFALSPMGRPQLDEVISGPPFSIQGNDDRNLILDVAEGSPLIAHLAARMVANGQDIRGLTADDVLKRYLNEIVQQVLGEDQGKGRDFLAVLAGIGSIDGNTSAPIRVALRERLALSLEEESRLIGKLLQGGILHKGYRGIRITPDLLSDHILQSWFFDSTPTYDFKASVLDPFFRFKAADIMRNLAEAEYRDEGSDAGSMLGEILEEFGGFVVDADNNRRLAVLQCISKLDVLRPEEALYIVSRILANRKEEPAVIEEEGWGRTMIREDAVLTEAQEIIERIKYYRPGETLDQLVSMTQLPEDRDFWYVRKKTNETIDDLFKLKPRTPWTLYHSLLDKTDEWLDTGVVATIRIVELLSTLLQVHMHWAERSATDKRSVILADVMLQPSDDLLKLRSGVFHRLRAIYESSDHMTVRRKIIDAHDSLAVYHPQRPSDELQALLNADIDESVKFFTEKLKSAAALYERFEIWAWAKGIERHGGYAGDLSRLTELVDQDPQVRRYLYLVDYPARYDEDHDWKAEEKVRQDLIKGWVGEIDEQSLDSFVASLEEIVAGGRLSRDTEPTNTGQVLRELALVKPDLAVKLLDVAAEGGFQLLHMAHWAIAGLRVSKPEAAARLVKAWVEGGDSVLGLAVARCYWWPEGSHDEEDFVLVEDLASRREPDIATAILRSLPTFQFADSPRTVGLLKSIATWVPDWTLASEVAQLIAFPWDAEGRLHILTLSREDLVELVWNFARLQRIDAHQIEPALGRLLEIDPVFLLQLLRHRIGIQEKTEDRFFDAIPFEFHSVFEGLKGTPQYVMMLRELRGWVHESNGMMTLLSMEASRLFKQLTGGHFDEGVKEILEEWIGGSVDQMRSVAQILHEFGIGPDFYPVARRLVDATDDKGVLAHISTAIHSTGVVSVPLSSVFAGRIPIFREWLGDPSSSVRVRAFARKMIRELTASVEQQEEIEEDREREYGV